MEEFQFHRGNFTIVSCLLNKPLQHKVHTEEYTQMLKNTKYRIIKKGRKIWKLRDKGLPLQHNHGVLAHRARARHWQCRGERFESAILHPSGESGLKSSFAFFVIHSFFRAEVDETRKLFWSVQ